MRNYGIDLYRIILTFMICVLHTLGQGGLLSLFTGGVTFNVLWLLETMSYCAVDGYGLITGYNAKEKDTNFSKIASLWLQVFFYSFIFSFLMSLIGLKGNMSTIAILKSAIPVSTGQYWYFSAYLPLMFFEPYIVKCLNKLDDIEIKRITTFAVGIFCFSGLITDAYKTGFGYSFLWLLVLYVMGYSIKRLKIFEKTTNMVIVLLTLLMVFISWIPLVLFGVGRLINYISPTIVLVGICLIVLFSRLKPNEKIVKMIAPLTFGIYLFQNNRIIWNNLKDLFIFVKGFNMFLIVLMVFILALCIFVVGAIVEFLRRQLFKLLKINKLADKLGDLINYLVQFIEKLLFL